MSSWLRSLPDDLRLMVITALILVGLVVMRGAYVLALVLVTRAEEKRR